MSKKLLTTEEVQALKSSPYVESVSARCVIFTPEFKKLVFDELCKGRQMKEVLEGYGIDTAALGQTRVNGFREKIEIMADREEGFRNLKKERQGKSAKKETDPEEEIRVLRHKLAYVMQENDFLKKIRQADMEAQKQWESKHPRK